MPVAVAIKPPPGGIKQCFCLTSIAYMGPSSRTESPRKTKIGIEVAHVAHDSDTTFKVKGQLVADVLNSQHARTDLANKYEYIVNLQRAEAYCVATRTACYL